MWWFWDSASVQGYQRFPQGYPRLPKVIQGFPRLPKVTKGYPKLPKVIQGYPRLIKVTHSSMSLHASQWAYIQFHELVCSSFLCLSSSQEFFSACFVKRGNSFLTYLAGRGNSFQRGFNSYVIFISTSCGSRYWGHRVKSCVWCLCRGGGPVIEIKSVFRML